MSTGGKETEIKLAVRDLRKLRRQLRGVGLRVRARRSLERNTLFDTPRGDLRRFGLLLRLRSVAGKHRLTFKAPAGTSRRFKVRKEWEAPVADPAAVRRLLAGLGFVPGFRYDKFRTEFAAPGRAAGLAMLDETPIGNYLELEGSQRWIRSTARRLGYTPRQFIARDYGALYRAWCRRLGRRPANMVFRNRRPPF